MSEIFLSRVLTFNKESKGIDNMITDIIHNVAYFHIKRNRYLVAMLLLVYFVIDWVIFDAFLQGMGKTIINLNTLFIFIPTCAMSFFVGKIFLKHGYLAVLLMGAGAMFAGVSGLLEGYLSYFSGPCKILGTVHNLGMLLSAVCLFNVVLLMIINYPYRINKFRLATLVAVYSGVFMILGVLALLLMPPIWGGIYFDLNALNHKMQEINMILDAQIGALLLMRYFSTRRNRLMVYFMALVVGLVTIVFKSGSGYMVNFFGWFMQYECYIFGVFAIWASGQITKNKWIGMDKIVTAFFSEAENNYKAMVETLPYAIILVNYDNKIILFNDRAEELLRVDRLEVLGDDFPKVVVFDDEACYHTPELSGEAACPQIVAKVKIDGDNWCSVEIGVTSRQAVAGPVRTYIIRDITEELLYQREMARLSRMDLVGEMAAAIGHEIRNPMTTVRGYLQFLAVKQKAYHEQYKIMIGELDRANAIITEYIALAKNRASEMKLISLKAIVERMIPLMEANAAGNANTILIDAALDGTSELYLDEKDIQQLLMNLVRNSIEASATGKSILVRVYKESNKVVLLVSDSGPGFSSEVLDKLGMPFLTTKPNGTGLGLAVCYRIAERHNATIQVQTSSYGTNIYVRFPTN
ncbi:MAG: rane signaling protein [Firmicutes bacterium]|nr:rane signaling protein [Bacillota bacterium]